MGITKALGISVLLLCAALVSGTGFAQDDVREAIEETDVRIVEAIRQIDDLAQRTEHITQRVRLLKELGRQLKSLQASYAELERSGGKGAKTVKVVEAKIELAERNVAREQERLHLHEQRGDLIELLGELREAELNHEIAEVRRLLKDRERDGELIEQEYKAEANQQEEALGEISREREKLDREFEYGIERVHLKLRIHWAKEEGEFEEVEDLQRELKQFQERSSDHKPFDETGIGAEVLPIVLSESDFAESRMRRFDRDIAPVLMSACGDCHASDSASGDLDLENLIRTQPLVVNRQHWLNVVQQIKVRSMPPPDEGVMGEAERRMVAAWITREMEQFDYRSVRRVGHESARRLTREEYNHTIRDLVGVDLRPADRFPPDLAASSGFRNSANSLFFQPLTLERFVSAAESVVASAYPVETQEGFVDGWGQLLGGDDSIADPKEIIQRFASRAFRRPATVGEVAGLMERYEQRIASGLSKQESLCDVIEIVLISPAFLFRSEQVTPTGRISSYEMANRLSYFLWASMPDDELFSAARRGDLFEHTTLVRQVDRMLDDPKAATLGTLFASQWFGTGNLSRVRPDPIDNPWATDGLIDAMIQETALLFHSLVRDNLPIDRLLDADFTFLNEELAQHYGIRGVGGKRMRRVSLTDTPRRGLLGHGSVLAVTSFPGRVSPVMRGNWILTELLGTPPPPPPPNVSEFDERIAENDRLNQREKLELHRRNPNCYSCHSQIDPLGFTLSDFDWFGRFRVERGQRGSSRGRLPDGREVDGLDGLIKALLDDRVDDLSRQTITKFLAYALGRQLEYYDEATVRELIEGFRQDDRRLRALIHRIVQTDTFQMNEQEIKGRDE